MVTASEPAPRDGLVTSFHDAMRRFPTGVSVITTRTASGPHGMTASAVLSVSLDPPTILVSLDHRSRTCAILRSQGAFAVNVLAHDQHGLATRFARSGGAEAFDGVGWRPLPGAGAPGLDAVVATLDCRVVERFDVADHLIVIGQVVGVGGQPGVEPLVHLDRAYGSVVRR
ncbi:flavin reductase family protein [Oerskovia turbata]